MMRTTGHAKPTRQMSLAKADLAYAGMTYGAPLARASVTVSRSGSAPSLRASRRSLGHTSASTVRVPLRRQPNSVAAAAAAAAAGPPVKFAAPCKTLHSGSPRVVSPRPPSPGFSHLQAGRQGDFTLSLDLQVREHPQADVPRLSIAARLKTAPDSLSLQADLPFSQARCGTTRCRSATAGVRPGGSHTVQLPQTSRAGPGHLSAPEASWPLRKAGPELQTSPRTSRGQAPPSGHAMSPCRTVILPPRSQEPRTVAGTLRLPPASSTCTASSGCGTPAISAVLTVDSMRAFSTSDALVETSSTAEPLATGSGSTAAPLDTSPLNALATGSASTAAPLDTSPLPASGSTGYAGATTSELPATTCTADTHAPGSQLSSSISTADAFASRKDSLQLTSSTSTADAFDPALQLPAESQFLPESSTLAFQQLTDSVAVLSLETSSQTDICNAHFGKALHLQPVKPADPPRTRLGNAIFRTAEALGSILDAAPSDMSKMEAETDDLLRHAMHVECDRGLVKEGSSLNCADKGRKLAQGQDCSSGPEPMLTSPSRTRGGCFSIDSCILDNPFDRIPHPRMPPPTETLHPQRRALGSSPPRALPPQPEPAMKPRRSLSRGASTQGHPSLTLPLSSQSRGTSPARSASSEAFRPAERSYSAAAIAAVGAIERILDCQEQIACGITDCREQIARFHRLPATERAAGNRHSTIGDPGVTRSGSTYTARVLPCYAEMPPADDNDKVLPCYAEMPAGDDLVRSRDEIPGQSVERTDVFIMECRAAQSLECRADQSVEHRPDESFERRADHKLVDERVDMKAPDESTMTTVTQPSPSGKTHERHPWRKWINQARSPSNTLEAAPATDSAVPSGPAVPSTDPKAYSGSSTKAEKASSPPSYPEDSPFACSGRPAVQQCQVQSQVAEIRDSSVRSAAATVLEILGATNSADPLVADRSRALCEQTALTEQLRMEVGELRARLETQELETTRSKDENDKVAHEASASTANHADPALAPFAERRAHFEHG